MKVRNLKIFHSILLLTSLLWVSAGIAHSSVFFNCISIYYSLTWLYWNTYLWLYFGKIGNKSIYLLVNFLKEIGLHFSEYPLLSVCSGNSKSSKIILQNGKITFVRIQAQIKVVICFSKFPINRVIGLKFRLPPGTNGNYIWEFCIIIKS